MRTKNIFFKKILFVVFVFFILLNSCKDVREQEESDLSVRDDLGNVISFSSPPQRIISLAPNITEALFAINAGDRVVGVTKFCDFPPEAKQKANTGGMLDPDYEVMTSLQPDLVIMTVEGNTQPTYQALERLGMKIFVTNPRSVDGIFEMITELGKVTGNETEAESLVSRLKTEENSYLDSLKGATNESCLLLISVNPLMTASGNTYLNDVIELAGFENIFKNEKLDYPVINREELMKKDPAFIILPADTSDPARIEQMKNQMNRELSDLKAVRESNVIIVDANILFRPGPRVLEGVRVLRDMVKLY